MALNIVDLPSVGTGDGGFFKPAEFESAVALLIEVTAFNPQVPSQKYAPRDEILATITAFASGDEIDADGGTVTRDVRIGQGLIVRDLKGLVGSAAVVRVIQVKAPRAPSGVAYAVNRVDAETHAKVVAFVERADEAEKKAKDELPTF